MAGFGKIDGRPALACAEGFTVLGGAIGDGVADKRHRLAQFAAQERAPLVFILEGAEQRLTNTLAGAAAGVRGGNQAMGGAHGCGPSGHPPIG